MGDGGAPVGGVRCDLAKHSFVVNPVGDQERAAVAAETGQLRPLDRRVQGLQHAPAVAVAHAQRPGRRGRVIGGDGQRPALGVDDPVGNVGQANIDDPGGVRVQVGAQQHDAASGLALEEDLAGQIGDRLGIDDAREGRAVNDVQRFRDIVHQEGLVLVREVVVERDQMLQPGVLHRPKGRLQHPVHRNGHEHMMVAHPLDDPELGVAELDDGERLLVGGGFDDQRPLIAVGGDEGEVLAVGRDGDLLDRRQAAVCLQRRGERRRARGDEGRDGQAGNGLH